MKAGGGGRIPTNMCIKLFQQFSFGLLASTTLLQSDNNLPRTCQQLELADQMHIGSRAVGFVDVYLKRKWFCSIGRMVLL